MPIDPRILEAFKKKGYKMERGDGDIEWQFIAGYLFAGTAVAWGYKNDVYFLFVSFFYCLFCEIYHIF